MNSDHSWKKIAAVAALGAVALTGIARHAFAQAAAAQPETHYKDQGEYDAYNAVTMDIVGKNFAKAITDLDTWKQKYPDSWYKDIRQTLYIQAYNETKQFPKVLDTAAELMAKGDLDTVFSDPKRGAQDEVTVLFMATLAVQQTPTPSPEQLATGEKAARKLLEFNRKPQGVADADWNNAKNQLQAAAKAALLTIAVLPGNQAMAKNPRDCDTAASVYTKALGDYPDKSFISYSLGTALNCIARAHPDKAKEIAPKAIYEFVRAAVTDPSLGGSGDPKKITDYANSAYTAYHGSDEGLDALKAQAKTAPLPPANFAIETSADVANRKQQEFAQSNPQLAMWMGIKAQLADPANGTTYFESTLKNAAVPKLKGTVVEGKPACRSKEILVAVPLPDQQGAPTAEITLKLDAPLTGKPETGEIQWEGVPSEFTQTPAFMLTMDTEKAKIEGLKTTPCAAAPARRGPATKKK
ncbi:MAG TPA: hypothetical protein VMH81_04020 [Bryobacteraceae bacterium]|nr:hypothetical protein [Bryobacteraceae bacterium]